MWKSKHQTLKPIFALLLVWLFCFAETAQANERISTVDGQKIIAIGDVHGDFDGYFTLMQRSGLVDEHGDWIGGNAIFVQIGDVPDRGPDSLKVIRHIMKIERQAKRQGGQVIALVGNHEAMLMTGDLRYVHPGEYAALVGPKSESRRNTFFKVNKLAFMDYYASIALKEEGVRAAYEQDYPLGRLELEAAWSPKGEIGKWVKKNPAIVIIDDTLFVHAGVSMSLSDQSVEEQNKAISRGLRRQIRSADHLLNSELGPLWYRGLVRENETSEISAGEEAQAAVAHYGVSRIVVGHTPNLEGINSLHGGRVIQIDTGMSPAYGGIRSYLRIEDGRVFAHDEDVTSEIILDSP